MSFDEAITALKSVLARRAKEGDEQDTGLNSITEARDAVLSRYQPMFALSGLDKMTEDDFRDFLRFENNRHWKTLPRLGGYICQDMRRLRNALRILLDESRPIVERLNELIPRGRPNYVPRFGKAYVTPILLVSFPDLYAVWNQTSEAAMKALNLWPDFERGSPVGERYVQVNDVCKEVARLVGVDLWTLDALWWRIASPIKENGPVPEPEPIPEDVRFGIERHLHEFLRDNWDKISLGREWALYEEDGDPDAGYEYPCPIGRIDLLARHRTGNEWLVVELKRNQTSDQTVGQVLRYMGWVRQKLAGADEQVKGMIIAHEADDKIRYALSETPTIGLQLYEVEFHLKESKDFAM